MQKKKKKTKEKEKEKGKQKKSGLILVPIHWSPWSWATQIFWEWFARNNWLIASISQTFRAMEVSHQGHTFPRLLPALTENGRCIRTGTFLFNAQDNFAPIFFQSQELMDEQNFSRYKREILYYHPVSHLIVSTSSHNVFVTKTWTSQFPERICDHILLFL